MKPEESMMVLRFFTIIFILCLKSVQTFPTNISPLYASYNFAKQLSVAGHIDNSHNHEHSKEVLFWSIEIIERLPYQLSKLEADMVGQCSLLHDFMDSKYINFSNEIRTHLMSYYTKPHVDVMMDIMNTMSYSKIVSSDNEVCYPDWVSISPFKNVFHITREADLLSSYNIARMIEFRIYNKNYRVPLQPNQSSDESIIREVKELYNNRMDKLIERNLFVHKSTIPLAKSLAEISKLKLGLIDNFNLNRNFDILRIVNYLSIDNLVKRFQWIDTIYEDSC